MRNSLFLVLLVAAPAFFLHALAQDVPPATAAPATTLTVEKQAAPSKAVIPPATAARNIRFQFDGIPYPDVIERFAQMVNKPLISNTNIQGTLTYNDPHPYTYDEALDTLNTILSMKGLMVVDTGNNLQLVPFKELPQLPHRIMRGTDSTGDVRPGEVVTVVVDVNNLDAKEVADSITPLLSNAGAVAPLSRGRGLIITDRMANIERIRTLLKTIDTEAIQDRQMKTYTLLHASGAIVSDLLNRTFGLATAPKRTQFNAQTKALDVLPPDPNDYITSVYDDASRTLVLFGPRERLTLAEELINKFEQKDGPGGDVRIYFPQSIKSEELAQIIRQAIPGVAAANETAANAATKARVIADSAQNRLIVAAPIPGQLDQIEQLINRVDKNVQGGSGGYTNVPMRSQTIQLTKVFRPRSAEATNLSSILSQALTRKTQGGQVQTTASVSYDPGSQSVVVSGSPNDVQIATDIVTQLETGSSEPMQLQTRFIDVGTVTEAKRLLPLVEQLYRNQVSGGGATAHAKILADTESGRLIVTASEDHLSKIENLVKQLRVEKPQARDRRLQIIPLEHTRVDTVLKSVSDLVTERMNDPRFTESVKPSITPDAPNNRLLVTGTDEQLAAVEQVVKVVDIAPEQMKREIRLIPLTSKTPTEIIPFVTQLLESSSERPVNPQLAPKLMSDPSGKQIVAMASAADLDRIEKFVQQFDTAAFASVARKMKTVQLNSHTAVDLVPLVQKLYTEQLRGQLEPQGGPATLFAEPKNNQIMLSGSDTEIARVETIIRQLEPEGHVGAKEETRVIRLKAASATELVGLVEKSLNTQQQQVRVLVDARSNSLVVSGDQSSVQAASEIIQQLDTRPNFGPRELRILELKSADANTLTPMLTSLHAEMLKDQRGADYVTQTKIVPDAAGNRIIVTGVPEEIKQVADLVERLDHAPEQAPGARVFKLTSGDATILAPIVSNAMVRFDARGNAIKRVTVTPDDKSNSLIVSGTRSDLTDVASVIEKLDGDTSGKERVLKIIDVKFPDPDGLAALAMKVFTAQNPGRTPTAVSITAEAASKRLIVLAPANMLQQVQTVIETLDAKPDQGNRELQSVAVKNSNAADLLTKVMQIYGEQSQGKSIKPATIYADNSGKSFNVYGTSEQAAAIRQIVETLDTQQPNARETRTIDIGTAADVQRLVPLAEQLYADQWKNKGASDPADAKILPDAKAGRVIVTGRPEHLQQIEKILQQLGGGKAQTSGRETRVFDLTTASAMELATTVRTLYTEQSKTRLAGQIPDTLILPDSSANRLIITGETNEVDQVEEIIHKLDKIGAQSASTRVFKLKSASPEKISEILSTAMVRYDAYGRPQKRVTIVVDAQTRTLIATGDPKELQGLAVIVEQLDASLGAQPARQMKVVQIKTGKVTELSARVRQLYNDQLKSQPELGTVDALILEDVGSNQLILAGNDAQLQLIERITKELQGSRASDEPRETKIIPLAQPEDATRLLPMVQQIYQERWRSKDANDPADAQIMADAPNSRFVITGRTNHLAELAAIIAQVNAPSTNAEMRDTLVFELKNSTAAEIGVTVRSLYQEEVKSALVPATVQARILPDLTANRLIITGSTNEIARVEAIINKLDQVTAKSGSARVFKLQHADAEQVATVISTALVQINPSGIKTPRVSVGADKVNNLIVANGEPKDIQSVAAIVEQMDAVPAGARREMRIIPLKSGSAQAFATRLQTLYRDALKGQGGTADALILGDESSSRVIITASEEHLKTIEEIVKKLEESDAGTGRQLRVIPIENGSSTAIAAMLTQIFATQAAAVDPSDRLIVSALADDRTLVIEGPEKSLDRALELVQSLDAQPEAQEVIQTVHLKKGRAEDLATSVTQSIRSRTQNGPLQRVKVTPVSGANTLLINGPKEPVDQVIKIITDLDQDSSSGEIEVHIYKLENGSPKEVSNVLQQLLQNVSRQGRLDTGRFVPASISVDDRSNSLIISGSAAHFKVVEKILPTLDKAPERSDRDVQFVWLRKAKAYDVVSKIESVFDGRERGDKPILEADSSNNSLTIISKRADMKQIQDLIARLDETATDTAIQVRMRSIDSVNVEQMARMLQNLYPQVSGSALRIVDKVPRAKAPTVNTNAPQGTAPATPAGPTPNAQGAAPTTEVETNRSPEVVIAIDKDSNSLILSGPGPELDQIDRLISDLSFSFYGNESEFRVFSLKYADPVVVARMLGDLMKPEPIQVAPGAQQPVRVRQEKPRITIVPEPRTRGVVVRARPTDFALLESIIKQLDSAGDIAQVDFRVIPLTNASPFRLLPLIQQMVTQLNTARPGEQVTITPDARSRGILVVARSNMIDQVEKMIHSLDIPAKTSEAEVLIVPLKHSSAAQVSGVLQAMVRPGAAGETTAENRELEEQVRRLKVQNEKGEAVSIDLSKPIKVNVQGGADAAGAGGNRLILTSTPDNLKALEAVALMLDSSALTEGVEVKLVPLQFADAAAVSQTLTTIFTQGQRLGTGPGGKADPESGSGKAITNPLNVAVDARSNTLILSGRQESIDLALRVIKDLDQKLDRFLTEVRLYRLKHATATRLVPLLQSVFAEGPVVPGTEGLNTQVTRLRTLRDPNAPRTTTESRTRSALVIQADDLSNTLIISAKADTLPLIEDVIEQLDIPAASGLESVRVYPLNHADPTAISKILSDLYTGPRSATLRNEDKPIISVDPRTSSLIVAGNSKAFAMLDGLLQQLDQKLPFELRDIHIIPLQHTDAQSIAATLQKMLDARVTQQAALNRGQADNLKVIVLADSRSNSLLIGGSKDSFELAESLARQLDTASPAVSGRVRLIPLAFADSRVIANTLTTLFTARYAAVRAPDLQQDKPIILPDPRSNSLLVAANMDDNAAIDDLLKKLDRQTDNPSLVLTVIQLQHNDATRVGGILESIFAARQRGQTLPGQTPSPADLIKIEPDTINNALIVSASKENLAQMATLLEKIDVEPTINGGLLQIFTLQYADAQRVAAILKSLVSQGLYRPGSITTSGTNPRAAARDALAVSVDPRSNTLMISASPENLAIVKEIIQKLDNKDYSEATGVRAYALKNSRASTLATTLTQFFQAKHLSDSVASNANDRTLPVSVIPDDRTNVILVTGGKEAFETVERLLQQLDGEGVFARMNFRVFPLKKATAIKLQPVLQQIFANRTPRVRGEPIDPITVVADAWVNALLVGASVEDMGTVESLIQRLDTDQNEPGIAVHVFQLVKADARKVAVTIQGLYREGAQGVPGTLYPISVTADERMNAIVVSAGENDVKRIGELIKKLDTDQVARVSEIKVFPLRYARAETLSTILNSALNTKPVALGDQNPNAQSVLQFITRSEGGQDLITAALKEAVLITPDSRMNSLIVSGPVDYMTLLDQIITRLDASSPQQAKIKVFALQNADARQMADLLMNMFRMTASTPATPGAQRSIQYTLVRKQNPQDGGLDEDVASATVGTAEQTALTVTVDPRTNSLLVGGTDHYVELVSQIIESLDSTPANERKTEVVHLKNSQAVDVAAAIRGFLDQERQRVTSVLGAQAIGTTQRVLEHEVAVVAEQSSNTLLVSANPRYFPDIKSIIEELDKPVSQVMIQVLLAEVTLDGTTDLGFEWSYSGKKGDVTYGVGTDFNIKDTLKNSLIPGGFSSSVAGSDFSFLLRALKDEGRLEVLSRPQIVTADNKPASINVGQRIPLITDSRVTAGAGGADVFVNSFRYEDVGVTLTVTPKINPDGFVRMEIGTTNSAASTTDFVPISASANALIINQRKANTTVTVQSGQTVIIGGLISTSDDKRVTKVPWLGDIPGLGFLFRSKHSVRDRKELMVLLTPQVLANSDSTPLIRTIEDVTREQLDKSRMKDEIKRDELQKQLLDPLFPNTIFEDKKLPQPKT